MPVDSFGMYVPGLVGPPPPSSINGVGSGSPEGVYTGWPPNIYLDSDTGELYFKASGEGTNTGWVLVNGGGGGAGLIGSGAPAGTDADDAEPGTSWLDNDTDIIYYKKLNGSWTAGTSV